MKLLILFCLFCLTSTSDYHDKNCMDSGAMLIGVDFDNNFVPPLHKCNSTNECLEDICQINQNVNVSYVSVQPLGPKIDPFVNRARRCFNYGALMVAVGINGNVTEGPSTCSSHKNCLKLLCRLTVVPYTNHVAVRPYGP